MTDKQWHLLKSVIAGEKTTGIPIGFIIDCPWLPNWYGIRVLDYFSNDELWFKANIKAIEDFPEVMFLPGFWSEYGMCTEPSAFGARCTFPEDEFPHAHRVIKSIDEIDDLPQPDVTKDGMLPFMLNRLKLAEPKILNAGHSIRFSISRGPLNIASYLMGATEFLTAMMMNPDKTHLLLRIITDFLKDWHKLQYNTFATIDGIFMLDDIIGFIGEEQFLEFGLPYFKELYEVDLSVKFLHNDAPCRVSTPHLPEMGINLFNMGFDVTLNELKWLTGNKITMVGNLPPRDVLAAGTEEDVVKETNKLLESLNDSSHIIMSCGGGMPPGVSTENIKAFINTVIAYRK